MEWEQVVVEAKDPAALGQWWAEALGWVVVDDSTSLDQEVFNMEDYEGADWVRISDEVPVDEDRRDRALEEFQTHYHPGSGGSVSETALEQGDEELDEDENGQDPGRED